MNWRFLLDGVEKDNPVDWADIEFTFQRPDDIDGILETVSAPVILRGDAYDYVKSQFDSDYQSSIDITIQERCGPNDAYTSIFTGRIFTAPCEFNISNCIVDVPIEDQSYTAMILNNKEIKAYVDVPRSKNDVAITAATFTTIDFFTPSTGVYDKTNRECYQVYDCLRYLVAFMTDNAVSFDSVTFGPGGKYEDYWILSGFELRTVITPSPRNVPYISFGDLFRELDKRFNIAFYLDFSTPGTPKLWVEEEDLVFTSGNNVTLANVTDIRKSVRVDRMYAKIKLGDQTYQLSESGTFSWPDVQFFNHKEEEYHLGGSNNVDTTLDLSCEYIGGHNIIEDVLVNSVTDYDEDIFIVEADGGTGQAVQYDLFNLGAGPYSYNRDITNSWIAQRHLRGLPNDLILYLGDGNDGFEATRTASTTTSLAIPYTLWDYDTIVSDPNGNYNNPPPPGQYYYACPATGFYRFRVNQPITINSSTNPYILDVLITIQRNTSGGVLIESRQTQISFQDAPGGGHTYLISQDIPNTKVSGAIGGNTFTIRWQPLGFYADANDEIEVYFLTSFSLSGANYTLANGDFLSTEVETGGGTYQQTDPDAARIIEYNFSAPMTLTQYRAIQADPKPQIAFTGANRDGSTNSGWIEQITYRPGEGAADIKLITSINDDG